VIGVTTAPNPTGSVQQIEALKGRAADTTCLE
jgi:hypothetical protein